ncbi:MAG: site-specific DNA-methyltransferase [Candidatus Kapaibacterium sp.]|nr:MAG: site-specific DNA-methyltransferase [Candidatus Kapabacteria bacterium]
MKAQKKHQHKQDSLREQILAKIAASNLLSEEEHAYLAERLQRQYGLLWEHRAEDVETRLRAELPVLLEVPERRILPRFDDAQPHLYDAAPNTAPNHILIEGDNLHALSTLAFTHEGKVDVIYIDPPYNTGNKDFRYNDRFVEKEDAYRHSAWLGFMHRRLTLAHRLLKDTGVIFISIDDNEQAQLKLLCDEVFGEGNFIKIFSWVKTETPSNLSNKAKEKVEFVICYEKLRNNIRFQGLQKSSSSDNPMMKHQNTEKILTFAPKTLNIKIKEQSIKSGIYGTEKYDIELLNDLEIADGTNSNQVSFKGKFIWKQANLEEELSKGTILTIKTKTMILSYEKMSYEPEVPPNLIDRTSGVGTNENAESELIEIGLNTFDYPKPTSLIQYLLGFNGNKHSLILDFFAGSGTTLHAVMALNAADGGERQCILVTNNENKIAEEVCYERNRRVIAGYTKPNGEAVAGLARNALRYYRTEFVGRERTSANREELTRRALDMLCIKENCYTEATPPEMNSAAMRFFTSGTEGSSMLVVLPSDYMDEQFQEAVRFIASLPERAQRIKVYVFSPSDDPFAEEFDEVLHRVELCALPEAILRAYREILPEQNNVGNEELDEESEE